MSKAGIARPRIAVAALNPHGGESGLFGMEEIEIIRPAVDAMAAKGFACEGPFPSDTVYLKAFAGDYDSVVAMYHDQGQIATKLRGFNRGVTVTAGLERSSPRRPMAPPLTSSARASPTPARLKRRSGWPVGWRRPRAPPLSAARLVPADQRRHEDIGEYRARQVKACDCRRGDAERVGGSDHLAKTTGGGRQQRR